MFEQAFRNIDDVLRKEAGCTTELDYTEQTSWLLFLKYLDGLEQDKADEAKLEGKYRLRSSDPDLSSEDIAPGYKQLLEVKRVWRDRKKGLDLRAV